MPAARAFGRDDTIAALPARSREGARACSRKRVRTASNDTGDNDDEASGSQLVAGELAEGGVRVHLQLMSFSTYVFDRGRLGRRPAVPRRATWIGDYPIPRNFLGRAVSLAESRTKLEQRLVLRQPELDALLDAARGEPDAGKRAAMYHPSERDPLSTTRRGSGSTTS